MKETSTAQRWGVLTVQYCKLQQPCKKAENASCLFFVSPIVVYVHFDMNFIFLSLSFFLSFSLSVYLAGCSLASGKRLSLTPHIPVVSIISKKEQRYSKLSRIHTSIYTDKAVVRVGSRKVICEKPLVTSSQVHSNALQHSQGQPSVLSITVIIFLSSEKAQGLVRQPVILFYLFMYFFVR